MTYAAVDCSGVLALFFSLASGVFVAYGRSRLAPHRGPGTPAGAQAVICTRLSGCICSDLDLK